MNMHVLLNLLIVFGKKDKMCGFCNEFNRFCSTVAPVSDSIHHMTLKLL